MPCLQIHDTWGCGLCEKQIWYSYSQCTLFWFLPVAHFLGIYQKVQHACVCLWASHASASLCTTTTLTLNVEPLAWETHSRTQEIRKTAATWAVSQKQRDNVPKQVVSTTHTHTLCRDSTVPTSSTSDETRSWPATNKKPVIFSEIGHRKWTFAGRTVIIQTCSKCAFPHEQQEENGIKLDQGRFILVKERRVRDWSIGSNNPLIYSLTVRNPLLNSHFSLIHYSFFPSGIGFHGYTRACSTSFFLWFSFSLSLLSLLIQSRLKTREWTSKDGVKLKKRISRSHLSSYVHLLNGNFSTSDLSFHGEICCDPRGVKS